MMIEEQPPGAGAWVHGFVGDESLQLTFRLVLCLRGQFRKEIFSEPVKFPTMEILHKKLAENWTVIR